MPTSDLIPTIESLEFSSAAFTVSMQRLKLLNLPQAASKLQKISSDLNRLIAQLRKNSDDDEDQ